MALSVKLQNKQVQGLSMTPQLAQSIKLLQMNSFELAEHIEQELENNPLLEISDEGTRAERADVPVQKEQVERAELSLNNDLDVSSSKLEENLGTSVENEFDTDRSGGEASSKNNSSTDDYSAKLSGASSQTLSGSSDYNIESFLAGAKTLRDHLNEQIALMRMTQVERILCLEIIDSLDGDGYFRRELESLATTFGVKLQDVEDALEIIQSLEPTGVGARDLGENIKLQLIEKNRFDPAIEIFIANLDSLAQRDFKTLSDLCGLELDEIMDIVHEIRALDPRPAKMFDTAPIQEIIPDVYVKERSDGGFEVELNSDALPKVLVNQTYKSIIENDKNAKEEDITYVADCLQNANWLTRSLEQRAQTIMKVTTEIVRQQDAFFAYGIEHLKPMSLRQVADAIKMHESTVSRVTSNKYMFCNRGMLELKFFFTAAIQSADGQDAHSAESVRHLIKQMIDVEEVTNVLSDDAIVSVLQSSGVDIARRTVAKYREAMHIPSSVQRRREKKAMASRK